MRAAAEGADAWPVAPMSTIRIPPADVRPREHARHSLPGGSRSKIEVQRGSFWVSQQPFCTDDL